MTTLSPLVQYYRLGFSATNTSDFWVYVAKEGAYNGDGSEMGVGLSTGLAQLTELANGLASGFEENGYENVTLVSIEAVPLSMNQLYP